MKMYKEPVKQYSAIPKRARTIMNTSMRYIIEKDGFDESLVWNCQKGLKYYTIIVDETKTYTLEQVKLLLEASRKICRWSLPC